MSILRKSALTAGFAQYVVYFGAFLQVAVVSRILTPAEVGTYLLASSLVVLSAVPRNLGVMEYIVSAEELDTKTLGACFSLLLVTSGILTAAYFFFAESLETFFGADSLADTLRIMATSFPFLAFGIIAQGRMRREMQFGSLAIIKIVGATVGFVSTIALVVHGWSISGIALGFLLANISTTAVVIFLAPKNVFYPLGLWGIKDVLRYGVPTSVGTFLLNLADLGPQLLLGRFTDTRAVGFYGRGQTLVTFVRQGTEAAMGPVVQPWFAQQSRSESAQLEQSFSRLMDIVCVVTWPTFTILYSQADFLIPLLLGDAWHDSVPLAKALAIGGMFSPFLTYAASLQAALGKVGRRILLIFLTQVICFTSLALAMSSGLQAFAWALSVCRLLSVGLVIVFLKRDISLVPEKLIARLRSAGLLVLGVSIANLISNELLYPTKLPTVLSFSTAIALSILVWFSGLWLLKHELLSHLARAMDFGEKRGL